MPITARLISYLPYLIPIVCVALPALPMAIAVKKQFDIPVSAAAKVWEASQYNNLTPKNLLLGMGIMTVFIPFGIIEFLRKKLPLAFLLFFYTTWAMIFCFSALPSLFDTVPVRFLHPASYGTFPIIAALGLYSLATRIPNTLLSFIKRRATHCPRWCTTVLLTTLIGIYVAFTGPSVYVQVQSRIGWAYTSLLYSVLNYIPQSVADALTALDALPTGSRPVVVTDPTLPYDILVPVFTSDKKTLTGHPIHTLFWGAKEEVRKTIFSAAVSEPEFIQILKNHRIGYILVSSTGVNAHVFDRYPSLHVVYANTAITILTYTQ